MRKIWCSDCKEWVPYDPRCESKEETRVKHVPWCRLDPALAYHHPDLIELNSYLESLYVLPR